MASPESRSQPESEPGSGEIFDPRHLYAAYIYDHPQDHVDDIAALLEKADEFHFPVRYWWLSEAMRLGGTPDRLIMCVHCAETGEEAGLGLYQALEADEVFWDELEAANINEYSLLGRPVGHIMEIVQPQGGRLSSTLQSKVAAKGSPFYEQPLALLHAAREDVQQTAQEILGRTLSEAELHLAVGTISQFIDTQIDWPLTLRQSIEICRDTGIWERAIVRIQPEVSESPPSEDFTIAWSNPPKGIDFSLRIDDPRMLTLSPVAHQQVQITLARLALIITKLLESEAVRTESETELGPFGHLAEQMLTLKSLFDFLFPSAPVEIDEADIPF